MLLCPPSNTAAASDQGQERRSTWDHPTTNKVPLDQLDVQRFHVESTHRHPASGFSNKTFSGLETHPPIRSKHKTLLTVGCYLKPRTALPWNSGWCHYILTTIVRRRSTNSIVMCPESTHNDAIPSANTRTASSSAKRLTRRVVPNQPKPSYLVLSSHPYQTSFNAR